MHMLKAVKHLSMSATLLEVLQNANAIDILVKTLDEQGSGPHSAVGTPGWNHGGELNCFRRFAITFFRLVTTYVG